MKATRKYVWDNDISADGVSMHCVANLDPIEQFTGANPPFATWPV